jgi:uncharacterized protein YjbJ (UPF0337 family)
MGTNDKLRNKTQELTGKAKEKVGDWTDDESLQAEGKRDETAGEIKQAAEKVKDAFR